MKHCNLPDARLFWTVSFVFLIALGGFAWLSASQFLPAYDSCLIAIGSDILLQGKQMYKDLHTIILPGSYYLLALILWLAGNTIQTCQAALACMVVLVAFLLLLISRHISMGWLSLMPAAFTAVFGSIVCYYNSHHWDSLLFVLLFTYLVLHFLDAKSPRLFNLFLAGLCAGLSIFCYQNQILPVIAGTLMLSYLQYSSSGLKKSMLGLSCIVSGILAVFVPFFIFIAMNGTMTNMIDCTLGFVLSRYQSVNAVAYGNYVNQNLLVGSGKIPFSIFAGMCFGLVRLAPVLVFAGGAIWLVKIKPKTFLQDYANIAFLLVTAISLWLAEMHKPDFTRLVFGESLLLILLFYLVQKISLQSRTLYVTTSLACIFLLIGLAQNAKMQLSFSSDQAPVYITRRGPVKTSRDMRILGQLNALTSPGEKVLVYPYDTGLIYLAGTSFPSRYPVLHYGYHTEEQFKRVISDMETSKVKYAVWNRLLDDANHADFGFSSYKRVPADKKIMEPYLKSNFDFVGAYGDYCLFRRK